MKCSSCGGTVPDNASFCPLCGHPLAGAGSPNDPAVVTVGTVPPEDVKSVSEIQAENAQAQQPSQVDASAQATVRPTGQPAASPQQPEQLAAEVASESQPASGAGFGGQQQNPYGAASSGSWGQSSSQSPSNPYGAPAQPYAAPAQQPQSQPVYSEGCVSAALADMRATDGWLKRVLFLGLVGCVPILNFVTYGYALNWAREVPFGGKTAMPSSVVNGKNFEIGFYYFVISLVFGLVGGLVSGIVGIVPVLGWIAAIVISLAVSVFVCLCSTRMAIMQQLGEGFKLRCAWNALKRNWTSLAGAVIGPVLVVSIVAGIILSIGAVVLAVSIALPVSLASGGASGGVLAALGTLGVFGVLAYLLIILVCVGLEAIAYVVAFRAVGHWVGRYAPEWTTEAYQAAGYTGPQV